MPVLREVSVLIMDGAVKLYRRDRSRKWQAAFQIDGQYIRISTGKSDLDEAKTPACSICFAANAVFVFNLNSCGSRCKTNVTCLGF